MGFSGHCAGAAEVKVKIDQRAMAKRPRNVTLMAENGNENENERKPVATYWPLSVYSSGQFIMQGAIRSNRIGDCVTRLPN